MKENCHFLHRCWYNNVVFLPREVQDVFKMDDMADILGNKDLRTLVSKISATSVIFSLYKAITVTTVPQLLNCIYF